MQEKVVISEINEELGSILHIYYSSNGELDSLTVLEGTFIKTKIWSEDNNSIYISSYSDDFDFDSFEIWVYDISDSTLVNITNGTNPIFYQNEELNTDNNAILNKFHIMNYPNPFNPVTTLRYDLPEDAVVNITIYDMMGRQVKTLVNGSQTAGYKSIQWNATNNIGKPASAGLYLYTIQAGKFKQTKKMVLLK